jgi:hypothetical protein
MSTLERRPSRKIGRDWSAPRRTGSGRWPGSQCRLSPPPDADEAERRRRIVVAAVRAMRPGGSSSWTRWRETTMAGELYDRMQALRDGLTRSDRGSDELSEA